MSYNVTIRYWYEDFTTIEKTTKHENISVELLREILAEVPSMVSGRNVDITITRCR